MILKWNDSEPMGPNGTWHLADGISDVMVHGRMTIAQAQKLAEIYDGEGADVTHMYAFKEDDEREFFEFVSVWREGTRRHWLMDYGNMYVLSDEGKTVDKFY